MQERQMTECQRAYLGSLRTAYASITALNAAGLQLRDRAWRQRYAQLQGELRAATVLRERLPEAHRDPVSLFAAAEFDRAVDDLRTAAARKRGRS